MEPSSSPDGQPPPELSCTDQLGVIHNEVKSKLALMEGLVCLTFFLLMIQFPITLIRKRYSNSVFKVFAYGAFTAINLLLPYIFGLMFSSRKKHMDGDAGINLATFLLIAYMNGASVLSPYDSLNTESLIVKLLVYFTYILLMVPYVGVWACGELLVLILCLIYKIVVWRNLKTIKLDGGKRLNIRCMAPFKYLDDDNDGDLSEMSTSDDVLGRCNYVVDPLSIQMKDEKVIDRGTTIQTIWHGKKVLPSFLSFNENRLQQQKNTCLSFSLLWLLLHKFTGLPSYESSHQEEAWRFVRRGLIDHKNGDTFTFEVIEVELAFLSDFLYGNHFELYLPGFLAYLVNQFIFLGAISLNVVVAYMIHVFRQWTYNWSDDEYEHSINLNAHESPEILDIVSCVVVTIVTMLLFAQAIILINSRWAKTSLLCNYLNPKPKKCLLQLCNPCIKKAAEILCPIRCEIMKPWQRKLGQYSLIQSCSRRRSPLWKFPSRALMLITGIQFARPGRKESKRVILSDDIKKAVIEALKVHGRHLSNGINSLEARKLPEETMRRILGHTQFEVDAQVILVWHIATSLCEIHPDLTLADRKRDKFHVATSLSKYCAYLAVFAPNLLPGLPAVTDNSCSKVIEEAYTLLKDCESSNVYQVLMKLAEDSLEKEGDKRNIIPQGVLLGKLLLDTNLIEDPWVVLADVWSEMILYLAPNSSNEWGHAERLAAGGEFITHLWVLLFHAGIVERDGLRSR